MNYELRVSLKYTTDVEEAKTCFLLDSSASFKGMKWNFIAMVCCKLMSQGNKLEINTVTFMLSIDGLQRKGGG